jgi:hypothetical protein
MKLIENLPILIYFGKGQKLSFFDRIRLKSQTMCMLLQKNSRRDRKHRFPKGDKSYDLFKKLYHKKGGDFSFPFMWIPCLDVPEKRKPERYFRYAERLCGGGGSVFHVPAF